VLPELLKLAPFASQAAQTSVDGVTALVYAVQAGQVDVLNLLLGEEGKRQAWQKSVCDSVFTVCPVRVDMPLDSSGGIEQLIAGFSIHRDQDVVMVAVESGKAELLEPLLALPTVQARLRQDQAWTATLLSLAKDEGHAWIVTRIQNLSSA
jgi:hypothetical protein